MPGVTLLASHAAPTPRAVSRIVDPVTKPRSIACGDGETAARVEYVKSRGVLRLTSGAASEHRELTVRDFCEELGIDAQPVTVPTYLLFAGTDVQPAGGCRDLVATYLCPDEARREFTAWRRDSECVWAELICLAGGRTATVCWFGVERADRAPNHRPPLTAPSRRRRWRPARRRRPQVSSRA